MDQGHREWGEREGLWPLLPKPHISLLSWHDSSVLDLGDKWLARVLAEWLAWHADSRTSWGRCLYHDRKSQVTNMAMVLADRYPLHRPSESIPQHSSQAAHSKGCYRGHQPGNWDLRTGMASHSSFYGSSCSTTPCLAAVRGRRCFLPSPSLSDPGEARLNCIVWEVTERQSQGTETLSFLMVSFRRSFYYDFE